MKAFVNWNSKQTRIVPSDMSRFYTLIDHERKKAWVAANEQIAEELKAILIYCDAISCENNKGIIKLLVKEEIKNRVEKILEDLE